MYSIVKKDKLGYMKKINKLVNPLDDFIDSDYFQGEVKILRKKWGIPKNGFPMPAKVKDNMSKYEYGIFYTPEKLLAVKSEALKPINLAIKGISRQFPIHDITIDAIVKIYLFHNKKIFQLLDDTIDEVNLCRIEEIKGQIEEFESLSGAENTLEILKRKFKDYPVVIKLHPDISQRELIEYIKRNWHIITNLHLGQYKNKNSILGKTRRRDQQIQKRDDFIYKHKKLPRRQIAMLLNKKFDEFLDVGHIGKIISLESRRRKKV